MSWERRYYVYILASKNRRALYIGVTNSLETRLHQHRNATDDSFAAHYHTVDLVYCEVFEEVENAIRREKQLKGWKRAKKDALIRAFNPTLMDLTQRFTGRDVREDVPLRMEEIA